ncbi:SusC/RagA family TonB-linked outer membrane protein [Altibacter sp.]|uniref:SusC/RagA family TonB-linked outer membrane protein n=1 Tax=Altibacter sp. TaxID=2024823 RepID=UPI000C938E77|nr:SusC/RagA family TonB-linked outer membrane protein [Altibacter sp.]MAP55176.1 SusC/RagA family TonB-linked outer membrane protein [Altibacter sp.]
MKTKLFWIFCLTFLSISFTSLAQERTITGTVSDNSGLPLPGVNIILKGTTTGAQTDFDGNYSIVADNGDVLVFSYVGFTAQEIEITPARSTINVTLNESASELDEVVVTALGIKKEKKALGYAVTSISSEDIEQRATGDITKILQGKAAGVNIINASGLSGAGSSITIRGLTSTGNNQPLYVVDGVRFNSNTNGTGFSGTSRSLDIDPNSIETVNVLKGLSATTLYGADGKNGVIVITTKAGSSGGNRNKQTEVTLTVSTFYNEIASLPDFTDERGQGYYDAYYNFFGNWGATFGRWDYGNVDAQGQISHPYSLNSPIFNDGFPDQVDSRVDYKNYKSQENFFRTGIVKNINASVNGGSENFGYNLSVGNLDDQGFLPGNTLRRNTLSVGGNGNLANKINVSSTLNYSRVDFTSPFTGPIFTGLLNTPRSIDLAGWPSQHPLTGQEINFQNDSGASNPYWYVNNSGVEEDVNRIYGQVSASVNLTEWLSATYRFGTDVGIEQRKIYINRGSTDAANTTGALTTSARRQTLFTHAFLLNMEDRFAKDQFGISANVGVDISRTEETFEATNSTGQTVFDALEHDFFEEQSAISGRYALNRPGILAQATFDYNNYLFLTASARNDWTSNFENNSQFYPGVGLSFIPTQAFKGLKGDALNYFKIRANYGTSADFNVPGTSLFGLFIPYPTIQTIDSNSSSFVTANGDIINTDAISNTLANKELGPALIEEYEFGFESKFWKNRISFDASYFKRVTSDLIFTRNLDPSTGFISSPQNVNEFQVDGIELELNITAIKTNDFSFDIGGNFTKNDSEVTKLEEDRFPVAVFGTLGNYLVEGQPVNIILGEVIATDENGNYLTNGRQYEIADDIAIIGDPNPDWIASMFTAVRYKNLSLTANVQYRQGGDIYSSTARSLLGRGLTTDGDGLQNVGYVLPGINTTTGEPNEVVISAGDALFNEYNNGPDQFGIFDGTTIRIQEVALTYRFTDKVLDQTPFGYFSIAVVGENLYYKALNAPDGINLDTNSIGTGVNSNGAGIEGGTSPSSRRIGLSIKASF